MKKTFLTVLIALLSLTDIWAQGQEDEKRAAEENYQEPDAKGLANPTILSRNGLCLQWNPAGMMDFSSSRITVTPLSMYHSIIWQRFNGMSFRDQVINFGVPGVTAIIKAGKIENAHLEFSIGAGFNRAQNLYNQSYFEGVTRESSMTDFWAENSYGFSPDNLPAANLMMYNSYIFDPNTQRPGEYIGAADYEAQRLLFQSMGIKSSGAAYDIMLAIAAKYKEWFRFGLTFMYSTMHYSQTSDFTEHNLLANPFYYSGMEFVESFQTTGRGIRFAMGAEVKVVSGFELGASIVTPRIFTMHDTYTYDVSAYFVNFPSEHQSFQGAFDYQQFTPYVGTFSAIAYSKTLGSIGVDYQLLDYSSGNISSETYGFYQQNRAISRLYTTTSNLRLGGELRLQDFRIRLGYRFNGSPYEKDFFPVTNGTQTYSIGLGLEYEKWGLNVGYARQRSRTESFAPYTLPGQIVDHAAQDATRSSATLSLHFILD